jgi:hypothetical protein
MLTAVKMRMISAISSYVSLQISARLHSQTSQKTLHFEIDIVSGVRSSETWGTARNWEGRRTE